MSVDSPHIMVSVLGPLEALRDGRRVSIPGAKPRAVLTMLTLHARSVLPADILAAVLWGDELPRTSRKALQTYVSVLRSALGEDAVVTRGPGWSLAADETDVERFESLLNDARAAHSEHDEADALRKFGAALDVWRGPPSLPDTPRGVAETTRWIERRETAVDDRVDARLASGRAEDLIGELESAVAATPLRERRWAQLCMALYRAGRQGDALWAYQRARVTLAEELGVDPGSELRELEAAMLAHDSALDARTAVQPHDTPVRPQRRPANTIPEPPTTFVGRSDDLQRLQSLMAGNRIVTVVGPGGVGKSRLSAAAAGQLAPDYSDGVLFVDLASAKSGFVPESVAAALGVTVPAGQATADAVLAHVGQEQSLLLLDSCEHVVDEVGLLVGRLLAGCPNAAVLATSRERLRVAGERVYALPPLSIVGEDTGSPKGSDAELLFLDRARAVEPEFDADADLIGRVCARCDGLPLAIELAAARCASLGIDGLLAGLDDHLRLLSGAHVPTERHRSLRAVLDWSHDLLDASEQEVFRRLGIFVGRFDIRAATEVADLRRASVIDVVGRLTDKNLLVHEHGPGGSRWRMLDVMRSYARGKLTDREEDSAARGCYLRWASAMAVRLERRLDDGSAWRDDFDVIADDLHAAMKGSPVDVLGGAEAGHALALALALARLYARAGAFSLAQDAYEAAMSLARATGDAEHLANAALGASESGMLFGVTQGRRVGLLEEALEALGTETTVTRVRLLSRLATELFWAPDRERSLALAAEAAELANRLKSDDALAHALYARHYVMRQPDNWRERAELAESIMARAELAGETQLALAGRAARVVDLMEGGEFAAVDGEISELAAAANRLHHPEFQWYAAVYRLVRALAEGRYGDADDLAFEASVSAQSAPEFSVGLFFAEAVTDLRHFEAEVMAERDAAIAQLARRFPRVVVWRCMHILSTSMSGGSASLAQAQAMADELLRQDVRDGHWLVASCLLAEAAAAQNARDLAQQLGESLRPYAGSLAVAGRVAAFRGSVFHVLGRLADTCGDVDQAVDDLERAIEQETRIGARPFVERSRAALNVVKNPEKRDH